MNIHSIRWRLPLSYAAIALLATLALGSVMLLVLNRFYTGLEINYLKDNALALQPVVEQILKTKDPTPALRDQVDGMAFISQTQIRVLDANGKALVDSGIPASVRVISLSNTPAGVMVFNQTADSASAQIVPAQAMPETETGLASGTTSAVAVPPDVHYQAVPAREQSMDTVISVSAAPLGGYGFVSVSAPLLDERSEPLRNERSAQMVSIPLGGSDGFLELSNGPAYGADILRSVAVAWLLAGILSIALAALAGWYISRQVTRPVLVLTEATRRMEQGELSARVDLQDEKQREFMVLANSFNSMAQRVDDTIATLRAFASDAAHELNSPLTALKTNLELASETGEQKHVLAALTQADRLQSLVTSLLELSRIEATEPRQDYAPVDLTQITREIAESFASRAEQAERIFLVELPAEAFMVHGNQLQLKRVITNLLENALKFTPQGGSISLTLVQDAETATLTITDTGIGIPAEDLPHMFERFHRGHNASAYAGHGLGLAIAKALTIAHGGSLDVESEPGQGTSFRIHLPAQR